MKLVRALKQVSRMQGELKDLQGRLASCVSVLEENEYPEGFNELNAKIVQTSDALIGLRVRIMKTNVQFDMLGTILKLGELKQEIDIARKINIRSGVEVNDYMGAKSKYKSQLTSAERTLLIKALQGHIERLTDSLDDFNATTDLAD